MSREEENLVTWLLLVIGFLGIVWWGSVSMDFQKSCESSFKKCVSVMRAMASGGVFFLSDRYIKR